MLYYIYIYIYIYIYHQVVCIKKRAQPDDGLLEAKTCSWLVVTIIRCIYIYIYNMVVFFDFLPSAI
jgi:hypothetical protein